MADNQLRGAEVQDCPAIRVTQNAGCPSIRVRITGGGETPEAPLSDVNFYDYDGKRVASYTAADFAALTEMPANPSHQGLTAQGWNWSLSDAQAYVAANGILDIGQNYITDDGKTRLYIYIAEPQRLEMPLLWQQTDTNGVEVDWGDGSTPETVAGTGAVTASHTYPASGNYTITMTPLAGDYVLGDGTNTILGASANDKEYIRDRLLKVEVGFKATLANAAFNTMRHLSTISLPISVSSIGGYCFSNDILLRGLAIPPGCNVGTTILNYCYGLQSISIPKDATFPSAGFLNGDSGLLHLSIPIISSLPGNFAIYCNGLMRVVIPEGVGSLGTSSFRECYSLTTLTLPSTLTSIGGTALASLLGLKSLHIKATTPPTLGSNALQDLPADCVIYVPASAVATYQGATNWSTYASQIVGE